MELFDAIQSRRSVRNYSPQAVSKDLLLQLLEAAVQAPSAMNSQPWAFAVIQDRELLNHYSDRAKAFLLSQMDQHPPLTKYRTALANPDFNIFYNAGTLLIVYAVPNGPHPEEDCCLAAQNIMLAAHGLGLGTCWIGFARPLLNLPEVKAELGVPAEYQAVAPLIVGYPASPVPPIPKKPPQILLWR
ncbi:nitroreductase family protein [Sporolituus thermophilus]|uniref:Nitroreductase n=1 Tax=Sporolituus thermophilus DSM 23256 TaxID=1123285 RepID=A0A1G7JIT5_9FIRM|nr:nitroreductase family protein [Sporolituus thermophilus]SDF24775.1 Nitroreductase [Sporolituus thermophilus DSM 23256]